MKVKRALGVIGDLHTGSVCAPWPEGIKTKEGVRIPPSCKQKILNKYLNRFFAECKKYNCDTFILTGDLIHGNNRREWGTSLMTPNLNLQLRACIKLLEKHLEGKKIVGVTGSKYHDSIDFRIEREIIERLGGKFLGMMAIFPIKKTKLHALVLHGTGGSAIYKETIMRREALFLQAAEGRGDIPIHIDIRIAGHWHYFSHIHIDGQHILQVPGWTDWIPWKGVLSNYGSRIPHIGGCIILIDDDDKIEVKEFLYKRPMIADGIGEDI